MLTLLATVVLLTTLACEWAARRGVIPYWVSRKILHVIAVGACAIAPLYSDRNLLIGIVGLAELILLYLVLGRGLFREPESDRPAFGIVWFPLAYLLLLLLPTEDYLVCYCMSILALCDPAATIAGKLSGWKPFNLTGDAKSIAGSVAFFLVYCGLVLGLTDHGFFIVPGAYGVPLSHRVLEPSLPGLLAVAMLLTLTEALGSRGTDNFFLPLLSYAWYYELVAPWNYVQLAVLLLAGAGFFFAVTKTRKLTPGGALTATVMGVTVLYYNSLFLLPLLLFFGSSVLIGKLFPKRSGISDAKHGQARDATQVLANGGVYTALVIYTSIVARPYFEIPDLHATAVLIAAAVATADTWSSEVGQHFRGKTYDLLRWKAIPAGLSGGVSVMGTVAGFLGALVIASLTYLFYEIKSVGFSIEPWGDIATITAFGFLGMLIDSLLGATFQATYRRVETDDLLDAPEEGAVVQQGYAWMTNDLVNFLAILITVLLFYLYSRGLC